MQKAVLFTLCILAMLTTIEAKPSCWCVGHLNFCDDRKYIIVENRKYCKTTTIKKYFSRKDNRRGFMSPTSIDTTMNRG